MNAAFRSGFEAALAILGNPFTSWPSAKYKSLSSSIKRASKLSIVGIIFFVICRDCRRLEMYSAVGSMVHPVQRRPMRGRGSPRMPRTAMGTPISLKCTGRIRCRHAFAYGVNPARSESPARFWGCVERLFDDLIRTAQFPEARFGDGCRPLASGDGIGRWSMRHGAM